MADQRVPAGQGFPDWAVGRTFSEYGSLSDQMYRAVQRGVPQPAAPAPVAPQPTAAYPSQDDFLARPAEATRAAMEYLKQTEFQPQFQQQVATTGQLVKQLVALQHPEEFKRYGPEIELTLQQYAPDPRAWTPDNLKAVVEVVRGRHVTEIAEERAQQLMAQRQQAAQAAGGTLRPDGGLGAGTSAAASDALDLSKLPPGYAHALKRYGVNQNTIDDYLIKTHIPQGYTLQQAREKWMSIAMKGDVIADGNEWRPVDQNDLNADRQAQADAIRIAR